MRADGFALPPGAETIVKRLKAIDEKDKRKILLAELRQILDKLDELISSGQRRAH